MKVIQCFIVSLSYLLITPVPAHSVHSAASKNARIETAADLQYWCKKLSYRHFRRKKLVPYNWSVTTIRRFNEFESNGSWVAQRRHFDVTCHIEKGKKAKYTEIEITPAN